MKKRLKTMPFDILNVAVGAVVDTDLPDVKLQRDLMDVIDGLDLIWEYEKLNK